MSKFFELKQQHAHALNKADSILRAAEEAGRELTATESMDVDTCMAAVNALKPQIEDIKSKNTLLSMFRDGKPLPGSVLLGGQSEDGPTTTRAFQKSAPKKLTAEYADAFFDWIGTRGQKPSAALYEGSGPAGGFVVPSVVDQQIVPLAPGDMGVRSIATVIPTSMEIKVPRATAFSTAAAKAESGATSNSFTESEPTLDQFPLSAFMAGLTHICSWELLEDVPSFQAFAIGDMLTAQQLFEENWYVNGTGTGQAQGLIGNVGAGVPAAVADASGNLLSIDATFDVLGTLKGQYHAGASFLMQRASGVLLRKAQKQANLFEPVFTRSNGQDYLHGYPVTYSTAMPVVAAGATPVLFGDFKIGYVIGDRAGSGINVKILDQPLATQGQTVLLAYRRTDGRVRRSEAIQAITLHT
jgi:HK97 family phage major capsid protein